MCEYYISLKYSWGLGFKDLRFRVYNLGFKKKVYI
jgi:hypothetical protein